MTETQAQTTRFCARIIGPLMLIVGAIIVARLDDIAMMISGILQDAPLAFVTGLFTLIVGLVLFVAHHHWTSATAILISALGVATILRGVLLMLVPHVAAGLAAQLLQGAPVVAAAVSVLIGLWLTWAGWFAKSV
jgi:hypothetical protein